MKPRNFPARVNARRLSALKRVVALGDRGKLTAVQARDLANQISLKLTTNARAVRTKKVRGASR